MPENLTRHNEVGIFSLEGELGQIYKQICTLNIGLFNVCWKVFGGLGCKIFLPIMEEEELRGGAGEGGGWSDSAHYHPHHLTFAHNTHISTVVPVVSCTQGMYGISSTFIATWRSHFWALFPSSRSTAIQSRASWILTSWTHTRRSRQVVKGVKNISLSAIQRGRAYGALHIAHLL